jgi:hypothetical protein
MTHLDKEKDKTRTNVAEIAEALVTVCEALHVDLEEWDQSLTLRDPDTTTPVSMSLRAISRMARALRARQGGSLSGLGPLPAGSVAAAQQAQREAQDEVVAKLDDYAAALRARQTVQACDVSPDPVPGPALGCSHARLVRVAADFAGIRHCLDCSNLVTTPRAVPEVAGLQLPVCGASLGLGKEWT